MAVTESAAPPAVVVVPGCWHTPAHFTDLKSYLDQLGHETILCQLPSLGAQDAHKQDVAADAAYLRQQVLLPLLKAGKEVILLMHSYGGVVGSAAATGLSQQDRRASGESGSVMALVCLSANLAKEGESLNPQKKWPPWISVDEEAGQLGLGDVHGVFYNDLSDEAAAQAIQDLRPQSISSLTSPSPRPAWQDKAFQGKLAYIVCTEDAWMPPSVQRGIMDGSGADWVVQELQGGHCAFLGSPKQLADIVSQLATVFAAG